MKSVCVIGGGVAGLSAAVFLTKENYKVTLIEASPKLGGRAYSFFDKQLGIKIDNGQHIFASWYKDTFGFLKIVGSYAKIYFQKQLEVNFADQSGRRFRLKCSRLPAPFHLLAGLFRYDALSFKDKMGAIRLVRSIKKEKIHETTLKQMNTDELFRLTIQTEQVINCFWKPFIVAVFNAEPKDTSALMFVEMIKLGFIEIGNSSLVLPNDFLSDIYVQPAVNYLRKKDTNVILNKQASSFKFNDNKITSLILEDKNEIESDFYVSTVPFFDLEKLLGNKFASKLETSSITNIHIKFSENIDDIIKEKFVGILDATIQWVFKVKDDQICVVISASNEIAEKDKEEIFEIAKRELFNSFPEIKNKTIDGYRVIKEMRATFKPNKDSLNNRPDNKTDYKNLFLAGDWTQTGLPATIEGAVRSSKNCVNLITGDTQKIN